MEQHHRTNDEQSTSQYSGISLAFQDLNPTAIECLVLQFLGMDFSVLSAHSQQTICKLLILMNVSLSMTKTIASAQSKQF
jgi:hypothetical protein